MRRIFHIPQAIVHYLRYKGYFPLFSDLYLAYEGYLS